MENCVRLILPEEFLVLLLVPDDPGLKWMVSDVVLLQRFWLFHLRLGILKNFMGVNTSLALSLLAWISDASIRSNSSMSATRMSPFQIPSAFNASPRNFTGKTFGPNWCNLDWSFTEIGWYSTIAPNGYYWSVKWYSEPLLIGCLPIRQDIFNVFADSNNTPWNPPTIRCPDLIATVPQMSFLFTLRTALSAIPFVSDLCGVDVQRFQERSSQYLPNSKGGVVSVNDFWFAGRLQELLQAPLRFLRSFCLARIRLDPLGGQVLHHDCISMIVSRFAIVTEDLVICCYQVTNIFSTRYGSAIASSARGALVILVLWQISQFRSLRTMSLNTVLTQIHTSHRF